MNTITTSTVDGKDIEEFINRKLLPVIAGAPLDLASAAMLHVIVASMMPDITAPDIRQVVEQIGAFIVTAVAGVADGPDAVIN